MMKPFSLYLLAAISLSIISCAQKNKNSNEKKDGPVSVQIPEKPIGWVSDFENIFSPGEIIALDSIIAEHETETSNEIAVVSCSLDSTQIRTGDEFDAFSLALFNKWGIGKKEKNNGVCVLISKKLRKVRIEVGRGLESKLTDEEAKTIIDELMVPAFKNGEYYTGISKGLEAIIKEIK